MRDDTTENDVRADDEAGRETSGQAKRAGRRGFCLGCLAAAIVGIVAIVVVLSMVFSSPEKLVEYGQRTVTGPSTVEQAIATTEAAQARALRGVKPVIALRLTDADVNAYIAEHEDELPLPKGMEDPRVAFGDGFVVVSVRTKLGFVVPVRVRMRMRPEVVDGRLKLHPVAGRAGKIGLPSGIRDRVARTAGKAIQERLDAGGFDLQRVEVQEGALIVGGKLEPVDEADPEADGGIP
jgi:hypothetical protein